MSRSLDIASKLTASQDSLGIAKILRPTSISEKPGSSGQSPQIQFGSGPDPVQQTKQLKGFLLANIDLVQHQQQILMAKDKTIQSLRQENETMRSRLERIERRMLLAQQREQQQQVTPSLKSDRATTGENQSAIRKRGSGKHELPSAAVSALLEADSKSSLHHDSTLSSGKKQTPAKRLKLEITDDSFEPGSVEEKKPFVKATSVREIQKITDCQLHSCSYSKRVSKNSEVLTTQTPYYVQPPAVMELISDDEDLNRNNDEKAVPVPSWRYNIVHGKYVIEGTENLDDHIFLKRHQKSENEEKKRKRWDTQRLRDLHLLQKYQPQDQKHDEAEAGRNDNITFQPDIEKARFIEVSDSIPVSAFGCPLPNIKEREFSLEWYSGTTSDSDSTRSNKNKSKKSRSKH